MSSRNGNSSYSVSGPGVDELRSSELIALVRAQAVAGKAEEPASWYVRNAAGDALWRVERNHVGVVLTYQVAVPA